MQEGDICFSGSGHTWCWKSYMTLTVYLSLGHGYSALCFKPLVGGSPHRLKEAQRDLMTMYTFSFFLGQLWPHLMGTLFVALTQTTVIWEDDLSIEDLLPSAWPMGHSLH